MPDARLPIDAAADAAADGAIDGMTLPVELTITRRGAPAANIPVYFLNADSSVVKATATDASGIASAIMDAGGSVTAIDTIDNDGDVSNDLRTFAGVKPGDRLTLALDTDNEITVRVNVPVHPDALFFEVFTTCGNGSFDPPGGGSGAPGPGGNVTLNNCNGTADFAVVAWESFGKGDQAPAVAFFHADVPVTDGGTVNLIGDVFEDLVDVAFNYSNLPPQADSLFVQHTLVTARGPIGPFSSRGFGTELTIPEPAVSARGSIVDTTVRRIGQHHVIEWGNPTATYTLNLEGVLLPDMLRSPSYNTTTRRISWMESEQGAMGDLTVAQIDVSRSENETTRNWRWTLAAPYTRGEATFPTLPTDRFDFNPRPTDFVDIDGFVNAKIPGGYDAARARIHDTLDFGDARGFVTGLTGRAVIVEGLSRDARRRQRR